MMKQLGQQSVDPFRILSIGSNDDIANAQILQVEVQVVQFSENHGAGGRFLSSHVDESADIVTQRISFPVQFLVQSFRIVARSDEEGVESQLAGMDARGGALGDEEASDIGQQALDKDEKYDGMVETMEIVEVLVCDL